MRPGRPGIIDSSAVLDGLVAELGPPSSDPAILRRYACVYLELAATALATATQRALDRLAGNTRGDCVGFVLSLGLEREKPAQVVHNLGAVGSGLLVMSCLLLAGK